MSAGNYFGSDEGRAAVRLGSDPRIMLTDPMEAVRSLWVPYFRFWLARPDGTVFYHRFRDSACYSPGIQSNIVLALCHYGGGLFDVFIH